MNLNFDKLLVLVLLLVSGLVSGIMINNNSDVFGTRLAVDVIHPQAFAAFDLSGMSSESLRNEYNEYSAANPDDMTEEDWDYYAAILAELKKRAQARLSGGLAAAIEDYLTGPNAPTIDDLNKFIDDGDGDDDDDTIPPFRLIPAVKGWIDAYLEKLGFFPNPIMNPNEETIGFVVSDGDELFEVYVGVHNEFSSNPMSPSMISPSMGYAQGQAYAQINNIPLGGGMTLGIIAGGSRVVGSIMGGESGAAQANQNPNSISFGFTLRGPLK